MKTSNLTRTLLLALTLAAAAAAAAGCAKDRTPEDYKRDKAAERIAQIEAVSGTYGGALTAAGNSRLGAVTLKFGHDMHLNNSASSTSTEPQATLTVEVRIQNGDQLWVLPFTDGYYDAGTGDFRAEASVKLSNGQAAQAAISGTFGDNTVTGRIEAEGFGDQGASFSLPRNGALPDTQGLVGNAGAPADASSGQVFEGMGSFATGPLPVKLAIQLLGLTSDQEFYNLFSPVKWVDLTILLHDSPVEFPSAEWDQRKGTLYGRVSGVSGSPAVPYGITLKCRLVNPADAGAGWDCNYSEDRGSRLFHAIFKPVRG